MWEQSAVEQEELLHLLSSHIGALATSVEERARRERREDRKKDLVSQLAVQASRRQEQVGQSSRDSKPWMQDQTYSKRPQTSAATERGCCGLWCRR